MLTVTERALTVDDRRDLDARLAWTRRESRLALVKAGAASALVCGALAGVTLWLSDAPRAVILAFWTALAALFTLWTGLPGRRLMRQQVPMLEDARRANRAREIRIQAARVVEFEEEEDEGACYAFEHQSGACVFVVGQEFYADDDFPNDDFAMVEMLGTRGQAIDVRRRTFGRALAPVRVVPAAAKRALEIPGHLAVIAASIDRVEDAIRRGSTS